MRSVVAMLVIGIAALGYWAWSRSTAHAPDAAARGQAIQEAPGGGTPVPGASGEPAPGSGVVIRSGGDPGVQWSVPRRWARGEESMARLATYVLPKAAGDPEDARCAVFYFGPGQGGDSEANLSRWTAEFDGEAHSERSTMKAGALEVIRVRVRGTYLAHAGMGPGSDVSRPGWELMGAIVDAPEGPVFFKVTGPAKTVDAAAPELEGLLRSLKKK